MIKAAFALLIAAALLVSTNAAPAAGGIRTKPQGWQPPDLAEHAHSLATQGGFVAGWADGCGIEVNDTVAKVLTVFERLAPETFNPDVFTKARSRTYRKQLAGRGPSCDEVASALGRLNDNLDEALVAHSITFSDEELWKFASEAGTAASTVANCDGVGGIDVTLGMPLDRTFLFKLSMSDFIGPYRARATDTARKMFDKAFDRQRVNLSDRLPSDEECKEAADTFSRLERVVR